MVCRELPVVLDNCRSIMVFATIMHCRARPIRWDVLQNASNTMGPLLDGDGNCLLVTEAAATGFGPGGTSTGVRPGSLSEALRTSAGGYRTSRFTSTRPNFASAHAACCSPRSASSWARDSGCLQERLDERIVFSGGLVRDRQGDLRLCDVRYRQVPFPLALHGVVLAQQHHARARAQRSVTSPAPKSRTRPRRTRD